MTPRELRLMFEKLAKSVTLEWRQTGKPTIIGDSIDDKHVMFVGIGTPEIVGNAIRQATNDGVSGIEAASAAEVIINFDKETRTISVTSDGVCMFQAAHIKRLGVYDGEGVIVDDWPLETSNGGQLGFRVEKPVTAEEMRDVLHHMTTGEKP